MTTLPAGLPAGLLAGLLAAAAAAMLVPAVPRARSARPSWGALVAGAGGCLGIVLALSPSVGGLAAPLVVGPVLVGLLALGVRWLVLARRRLVTVRDTAARVRECCESLAEELAAGSGPDRALARAARDWPPLGPVLAAHRVGLDVPLSVPPPPSGSGCVPWGFPMPRPRTCWTRFPCSRTWLTLLLA